MGYDNPLQNEYEGHHRLPTVSPSVSEVMLIDVLLLCTECQQPIKARINTTQWIRVEWIGPSGECRECYQAKREQGKESER